MEETWRRWLVTESLLIAWAMLAGVDVRVVGLVCVALWSPIAGGFGLALHIYHSRKRPTTRSAVFCQAVARELRAGSTLRLALEGAGAGVGSTELIERIHAGDSLEMLAAMLRVEFPEIGPEIETVVRSVAVSGAPSAALFEEMGTVSLAQIEMAEEIRVATSPARASALVLIGLPALYLSYQLFSGRFSTFLGRPLQQGMALLGLLLVCSGITAALLIVKKAS
jgi:Flp pilus assembly protein TadB